MRTRLACEDGYEDQVGMRTSQPGGYMLVLCTYSAVMCVEVMCVEVMCVEVMFVEVIVEVMCVEGDVCGGDCGGGVWR